MKKAERMKQIIEELKQTGEYDIHTAGEAGKRTYLILNKVGKNPCPYAYYGVDCSQDGLCCIYCDLVQCEKRCDKESLKKCKEEIENGT